MSRSRLHIQGEYPGNWEEIGDSVRESVGHRCIRCQHPFRTGAHGKGQWTPCDDRCAHVGPVMVLDEADHIRLAQFIRENGSTSALAGDLVRNGIRIAAEWRILTVHHLDGDKINCEWWNLLALCQRCHLTIQSRVNPQTPYFLEHSDWFKPYVAGFYAHKYEHRTITRDEALARTDELLAYERLA